MTVPKYILLVFVLVCRGVMVCAQPFDNADDWVSKLNLAGPLPEKLLSTRTVVFYSFGVTQNELQTTHEYFQRTGIDAVVYFQLDALMAGRDITRAFSEYFTKREIFNIVFLEKRPKDFRISITAFNGKESVIDPGQNSYSITNAILTELLKTLYRTASSEQKNQNLLINDLAEVDLPVSTILGKRNEFFATDLKVDAVAVPKFGDPEKDKKLEEIFSNNYPLKYKFFEPGVSDKEMRKQGFLYVLVMINTRGSKAKELLAYDMSKSETALVSVTYSDGQQRLKNISSAATIYKFYFKQIDSGNVFLGTKWDADLTWEEALINHIRALKDQLRIN